MNAVGISAFNHLTVVERGFLEFEGHISRYTFAPGPSRTPADYRDGLSALDKPFLMILGGKAPGLSRPALSPLPRREAGDFPLVICRRIQIIRVQ